MSERAVVTAGTGGIGLETAKGLAEHGFAVTVVGRDSERSASAVERIAAVATGAAPQFVPADLASLDQLRADGPGRIVNVTSGAIKVAKRSFDAVEPPGGYYGFHWYGRAKLANLAYTLHLAERLRGTGVTVFAADPGGAATDMTNGTMTSPKIVSPALRLLWPLVRRTFERSTAGPASVAARPSVLAATDASLDGHTGLLIGPGTRPVPAFRGAADPQPR
jgi:NAD(P)-dependent dehydrogenase (short-subunit alcohol dehydrogenase family)